MRLQTQMDSNSALNRQLQLDITEILTPHLLKASTLPIAQASPTLPTHPVPAPISTHFFENSTIAPSAPALGAA